MKHICLLAVVWVSLLTGCATPKPGKVLDPSVVNQLHVGQKRNDVLALIGQPDETDLGNITVRDVYWVFNDQKGHESGNNARARFLTIIYDARDVLLKSHYSQHELPVDDGLREFLIGRKFPADITTKIQPRVTKSSELIEWLGNPICTTLDIHGNLVMEWGFVLENRLRDTENKLLWVSLDDSGVVIDYHIYGFEHYFNPPARRKTLRLSGWR